MRSLRRLYYLRFGTFFSIFVSELRLQFVHPDEQSQQKKNHPDKGKASFLVHLSTQVAYHVGTVHQLRNADSKMLVNHHDLALCYFALVYVNGDGIFGHLIQLDY